MILGDATGSTNSALIGLRDRIIDRLFEGNSIEDRIAVSIPLTRELFFGRSDHLFFHVERGAELAPVMDVDTENPGECSKDHDQ
jgi:hypothetical protein